MAFFNQPVSGECCPDPCARSGPCDPCENPWVCVLAGGGDWEGKYVKDDFHYWYQVEDPAFYLYWETPADWWSFRSDSLPTIYANASGGENDPSAVGWPAPITSVILNGTC